MNEQYARIPGRKECDFIFGWPPMDFMQQVLYLRHNNSTMQSKVTINMRRRLSVFVCNSSFPKLGIAVQRHSEYKRGSVLLLASDISTGLETRHCTTAAGAAAAGITEYIFVKMDLIRAVHIGNDNIFCLKSNLKRYYRDSSNKTVFGTKKKPS